MSKTQIIERLGEAAVVLPELIALALRANDRAKLRLTLLQEAATHAAAPTGSARRFDAELSAVRLADAGLEQLVSGAKMLGTTRLSAPGLGALMTGLLGDLRAMIEPLAVGALPEHPALEQRPAALAPGCAAAEDALEWDEIGRLTSARRDAADSVHLLVMDMHRAINRLAAETAVEDIDGAKVHHLTEPDRPLVAAFMRGLHRTAPLAFGHPGLGAMAARLGERLTLQNDIGETDAHVLVLHVEGRLASVTYTDVHRRRAKFFMHLFDGRMDWSPLAAQDAKGLGDDESFYLITGRYEAPDAAALVAWLEFVGSRIVFLIDWNKARKALQTFVDRDAAVGLLNWAAGRDVGHRAFLVLGGNELVFEAVRRAAAGRVPYGARLDHALGAAQAVAFLRRVLEETSVGLSAGRSARLIRDEIQADLARRFETAEGEVLIILLRHLGLSRMLAALLQNALTQTGGPLVGTPIVERAKRMEAKADRLTLQAREACTRLREPSSLRRLVDQTEDAMDALDECAFLVSLYAPRPGDLDPLARLAQIVVEALGEAVRAAEASARRSDGLQEDVAAALKAIDAVCAAEREADVAERMAIQALIEGPPGDPRALVLGIEIARMLESSSDHVAHAALSLRDRVLDEMSSLGLPTPAAFALPTSLCAQVNAGGAKAEQRLADGLGEGIKRLEAAAGRRLGDARAPLLVSVRSGAAKSMPGMLSTVLNVGLGPEAVHGLMRLTGNPRFAWDCYRRFLESYATVVGGAPGSAFGASLAEMIRAEAAADESELDGEALERLTIGYRDLAAEQCGEAAPADPIDQLTQAALAVFRSWDSPKAREYRRLNGLEGLAGTAVTVQAMVFGNRGPTSGSGVAFTRNPATGEKGLYLDFLFDAQGEDVVSGRRTPMDAVELGRRLPEAFAALKRGAERLERAMGDVQDIEFTVEDGMLYFLQTRSAKRTPRAALRAAVELVRDGVIDTATALMHLEGVDLALAAVTCFAEPMPALAQGIPAAAGVVSGRAAFDSATAKRLAQEGAPVILVRQEPATEDIEGFAAAQGVLTAVGGRTAHAAVVARHMAKVCIVGCTGLQIAAGADEAVLGGQRLRTGEWISLDGDTGEVTLGQRAIVTEQPRAALAEVAAWAAAAGVAPAASPA